MNNYIECAIQKAIQRLNEGDKASTALSLVSIAQSLDRIASAQERMADAAEKGEIDANKYTGCGTDVTGEEKQGCHPSCEAKSLKARL